MSLNRPVFQSAPPAPMAAAPAARGPVSSPPALNLSQLVAQLGTQARMSLDGTIQFNEPLVQQIAGQGAQALPALQSFFQGVNNVLAFAEGLQVAGRMVQAGVPNVASLYPALIRWNSHPDPTVQIHLARFYRTINEPKTFGPMWATLMNQAVHHYPSQASPTFNVSAEVGETVLDQIARRTATETVQRLLPYLQPTAVRPR